MHVDHLAFQRDACASNLLHSVLVFFTERRCASAAFAVVMCLYVLLSVKSRYCIETIGRIELYFGMEVSFSLSHTVL